MFCHSPPATSGRMMRSPSLLVAQSALVDRSVRYCVAANRVSDSIDVIASATDAAATPAKRTHAARNLRINAPQEEVDPTMPLPSPIISDAFIAEQMDAL